MSINAIVRNYVQFSGDVAADNVFATGELGDSPAMSQLITLSSGDNVIDVPAVDDFTVHGVAVIPPNVNDVEPILKGSTTDTGLQLSASEVTILQFGAAPPTEIVLEASTEAAGFRLLWF